MTTQEFYELLQYKRYAVTIFSDFIVVPEEQVRQIYSPEWLKERISALVDKELAHKPMIIPLVQWQVGHTVLAVHSYNVGSVALLIGSEIGLPRDELVELMMAAVFHDVGKAFISDKIVEKNGALAPIEMSVMHQHPQIGRLFLEKHYPEFGDDVLQAVLMHHEKLDGSGYYGYNASDIGMYARIISVADILCAVSEERVYHHARSLEESLQILKSTKGLEKDYVQICSDMSDKYVKSEAALTPISADLIYPNPPAHSNI